MVPTLPLLAGFQQLVELDESKRILHELAQHRPVIDANSFSELKASLLNAVGWGSIEVLCLTGRLYMLCVYVYQATWQLFGCRMKCVGVPQLGEAESQLSQVSVSCTSQSHVETRSGRLQDILETWRLRTPNTWERLSEWSNIMVWRNHIYNIIINAFGPVKELAPHLHQLGYRSAALSRRCQCTCQAACGILHVITTRCLMAAAVYSSRWLPDCLSPGYP